MQCTEIILYVTFCIRTLTNNHFISQNKFYQSILWKEKNSYFSEIITISLPITLYCILSIVCFILSLLSVRIFFISLKAYHFPHLNYAFICYLFTHIWKTKIYKDSSIKMGLMCKQLILSFLSKRVLSKVRIPLMIFNFRNVCT